tara:strand:- start:465 stop:1220 length:756 start_codon:yes stop_codon:yes gene_type:complete
MQNKILTKFNQDKFYKKKEANAFFSRFKKNNKEYFIKLKSENYLREHKLSIYNLLIHKIKITRNTKVLEIGCFIGDLLFHLKKNHQCKINGVEPSKKACSFAKKKFKLNLDNNTLFGSRFSKINNHNYQKFDLVIVEDVLSWVDRKIIFQNLSIIDWLVKSDGYIFIRDFAPKKNFAHENHHWRGKNIYNFKQSLGHKKFFMDSGRYKIIYSKNYYTNKLQKIKIKNKESNLWNDCILKKVKNFTHPIKKF